MQEENNKKNIYMKVYTNAKGAAQFEVSVSQDTVDEAALQLKNAITAIKQVVIEQGLLLA